MMVFSKAMNTSTYIAGVPAPRAPVKMKNLLKNPANGGIPARENIASIIVTARRGLVL